MDGWIDGNVNEWRDDGWMDYITIFRWMDGRKFKLMERWMDGGMEGLIIERYSDGWMEI